jgi:hypothetical protein
VSVELLYRRQLADLKAVYTSSLRPHTCCRRCRRCSIVSVSQAIEEIIAKIRTTIVKTMKT